MVSPFLTPYGVILHTTHTVSSLGGNKGDYLPLSAGLGTNRVRTHVVPRLCGRKRAERTYIASPLARRSEDTIGHRGALKLSDGKQAAFTAGRVTATEFAREMSPDVYTAACTPVSTFTSVRTSAVRIGPRLSVTRVWRVCGCLNASECLAARHIQPANQAYTREPSQHARAGKVDKIRGRRHP